MTPTTWYYVKLVAFSALPVIHLLAPVGYYAGTPWLSPAFAFFGIPVLDLPIGTDQTRPLDSPAPRLAITWLCMIARLYVPVWLGTLVWAKQQTVSNEVHAHAAWRWGNSVSGGKHRGAADC